MKLILFAITILLNLPVAALAGIELPVENGVVTSGVGWRLDPFGSGKLVFHRGIDIAVPAGTPVHAVRRGRIVFAGASRGYGNAVIIEHDNGDRTLYGHNSLLRVQPGEVVDTGAIIAFSGNTGRSTGPHVHFEQMPSGQPVIEQPGTELAEEATPQLVDNNHQRQLLEQTMDESVNSILRRINRLPELPEVAGQGG